jgi:hypothetical protein
VSEAPHHAGSVPAARPPIPAEIKVLVASAFVIAIGFGLVSPVLPAYARSFDVGVAAASTVASIVFVCWPASGSPQRPVTLNVIGRPTHSSPENAAGSTASMWSSSLATISHSATIFVPSSAFISAVTPSPASSFTSLPLMRNAAPCITWPRPQPSDITV